MTILYSDLESLFKATGYWSVSSAQSYPKTIASAQYVADVFFANAWSNQGIVSGSADLESTDHTKLEGDSTWGKFQVNWIYKVTAKISIEGVIDFKVGYSARLWSNFYVTKASTASYSPLHFE